MEKGLGDGDVGFMKPFAILQFGQGKANKRAFPHSASVGSRFFHVRGTEFEMKRK